MQKLYEKCLPEKHKVVADIIRVGKTKATLLSDIMMIADIEDKRQAYTIIEDLINIYGFPIVASRNGEFKGYFYPANEHEFNEAKKTIESSINSMQTRYKNLINNYLNMGA